MSDDDGLKGVSSETASIGLARLANGGLPTELEQAIAMEMSIRALRQDARHNPNALAPAPEVNRARGGGWVDPKPLGQANVELGDKIVNALAGPAHGTSPKGEGKPAQAGPKVGFKRRLG